MTQLCPPSFRKLCLVALSVLLAAGAAFAQPTFQASASPTGIAPGSISTLTYTISNGSSSPATGLSFTTSLPSGLTVADPATGIDTCQGTLSAASGATSISYSGGALGGGASCSLRVNVTGTAAAAYSIVSGDLTSSAGNSGSATANVEIFANRPGFTKSFSPDPATFNSRVRLTFTIDNSAGTEDKFGLTFSDPLPFGMTVASPANASTTCIGGILTAVGGSSTVSYGPAGFAPGEAAVSAGSTCTVGVDVIAGSTGSLGNLSGELVASGFSGGFNVTSGKAGASLEVFAERLALTKTFVDDPVAPGGTVNLQFDLTNLDRRGSVTDIQFTDDLDAALSGLVAVTLPTNPCGSGSAISGSGVLSLSGGNLAAGSACSFTVGLEVPASASVGSYVNTTSSVLGDASGSTVSGPPATDTLFVEDVGGVELTQTFLDSPVGSGGSTTLQYTLSNTGAAEASSISFTDEFDIQLPTASAVPSAGFCNGTGTANYTALFDPGFSVTPAKLSVSGVTLSAGASCTFSITLGVSDDAVSGTVTNVTSEVTASVGGSTATSDPASADLTIVGGPRLVKSFVDDPALPGGTVTLEFTLALGGGDVGGTATSIAFTDDLSAALSGLTATGLPASGVCGAGSQLAGSTTLSLTGGTVAAGGSCTFSVVLAVPAGATPGTYTNATSSVTADIDGVTATTPGASDDLLVAGVSMTKDFLDDPVIPGGALTARYTISNVGTVAATDIVFLDNFNDALTGLTITGLPAADSCGVGSTFTAVSSSRTLIVQGGSVAAGGSCTFDVALSVPSGAQDDLYVSTTSGFSANIGGVTVPLANASATFEVNSNLVALGKEFVNDPVGPGGVVTLRFTLTNLSDFDLTDLAFTDDLDAVIPGLASVSGTLSDPCGPGSSFSGAGLLSLTGGMLGGLESCTFDVSVSVPGSVGSGPFINVTSDVTGTALGLPITGNAATDELEISALRFSKVFGVATAEPGDTVQLSFTIINDGGDTATDLSFLDDLDAMLSGLQATGLPLTDVCGTGSSLDGLGFLTFVGGTLPPNGSCTFAVDVVVPGFASPGLYLNVTENLRQGGVPVADPATASLEVIEIVNVDSDGDGVLDQVDVCPNTVIPESVPTRELKPNRYALVDSDLIFDTQPPPGGGQGPGDEFTTTDTGGCSCEQIIVALDLGEGHVKFGCSIGVMRNWVNLVAFGPTVTVDSFENGLGGWTVVH